MWKTKHNGPWAVTAWIGIYSAIMMLGAFSVWSR
jgi:hypothetical protein